MALSERAAEQPEEHSLGRRDTRPTDSPLAGTLAGEQELATSGDHHGSDGIDSWSHRLYDPSHLQTRWNRSSPSVERALTTRRAPDLLEDQTPARAKGSQVRSLEAPPGGGRFLPLRCVCGPWREARSDRGASGARREVERSARRVGKRR